MSAPTIRADLAQHMIYGAGVAALAQCALLVVAVLAAEPGLRFMVPGTGLVAALAAGVAKEVADAWANRRARASWRRMGASLAGLLPRPHEVSLLDTMATTAGAIPLAVVTMLLLWVMP
jgi:hypothetical protein